MATRTYSRDQITFKLSALDRLVAEGNAKVFDTKLGKRWVLHTDGVGSIKVTEEQVIDDTYEEDYYEEYDADAAYERHLETRYHDEIAWEEEQERLAGKIDQSEAAELARRRAAEDLVEELYTLRHGIAENRDGEFDEEERALVRHILEDEDGERELAVREEIEELKLEGQQRVVDAATARQRHEDELFAHFGI